MNGYPTFAQIEDRTYEINTDFRIAIQCNEVAQDESLNDYERALAVIYLLFGEKGLRSDDKEALLEKAKYYLSCGEEIDNNEEPDMDYIEDYALIRTSFISDFSINLDQEKMHWWEFNDLINGLSDSEFGNCCVLNRIRNLRRYDTREIKDSKERAKIEKAKEKVALKRYKKENNLTKEQEESMQRLNEILNIGR